MTKAEAEALLGFSLDDGWTFHEVIHGGFAGFIMERGTEIHAWRDPRFTGRWLMRGDLKRVVRPIIEKHGCVTTKVRQSNQTGHRFVTRLGFAPVGSEGGNVLYEARSLNHA